jgi:hypothetical protein
MTDPLSVTAGVVGITAFALRSVQQLTAFIESIRDAPEIITGIKEDLGAVEGVLSSLSRVLQTKDLSAETLESLDQNANIKVAVENCSKECARFRATLAHWMRHSTETKTFWWDRVRAGYFGEKSTEAFLRRLGATKATVNVALSGAILYVLQLNLMPIEKPNRRHFLHSLNTYHSAQRTEELKRVLLEKENEIQSEGSAVGKQIAEVDTQMQQLSIIGDNEQGAYSHEERSELLADLGRERTLLEGYRNVCGETVSKIHHNRTGQHISNIKMDDSSRLMVGFINTDGEELRMNQNITGVTATHGSRGIVGVAKNVNLDHFFD